MGFLSAVGSDGYSEREVYAASTDGKGHSSKGRFNLPPNTANQLAALVASGKTPYRTGADLIRDALVHRLHYWQAHLDDDELVGRLRVSFEISKDGADQYARNDEELLIGIRERQLTDAKHSPGQVRQVLHDCAEDLPSIRHTDLVARLQAVMNKYEVWS